MVPTVPDLLRACNSPSSYLEAVQKDAAVIYNYHITLLTLITSMEAEGVRLQALVKDFEDQNANLAGEIQTLKAVNDVLKDVSTTRTPSTGTTKLAPRLTPKHPDPDKFGGNKDELLQFTTQLKLKLNINADHYASPKSAIAYAISRLEGNALSQVLPLVKSATDINIESIDKFFQILEAAFGDPDKKGTAQRKIRSLRQTNRSFHEYLADFQRYVVDTGHDEEARLACLIDGLSQEPKSMLVYIPTPKTMVEAIETLQSLGNRRKMFGSHTHYTPQQNRRTPPLTAGNLASNSSSVSNSVKSTLTPPSTIVSRSASTVYPASSASNSGDAMDLSSSRPRGPLTPAERERRISLGLCLYCGGSGHVAKACPNSRKPKGLAVSEVSTRIEEVTSEDESGKA
jgi:hypothetical protein